MKTCTSFFCALSLVVFPKKVIEMELICIGFMRACRGRNCGRNKLKFLVLKDSICITTVASFDICISILTHILKKKRMNYFEMMNLELVVRQIWGLCSYMHWEMFIHVLQINMIMGFLFIQLSIWIDRWHFLYIKECVSDPTKEMLTKYYIIN